MNGTAQDFVPLAERERFVAARQTPPHSTARAHRAATCQRAVKRATCGHKAMKAYLIFALAALCVGMSSNNSLAQDAKLERVFKSYLDDYLKMRPMEATRLGDHRFDSQIEELTPAAQAAWMEFLRKAAAELPTQVSYSSLSRPSQIDFEIFQHSLQTELWLDENTHPFEQDPRVYNGYINDSTYLLLAQSSLPLEVNVSNCIARMSLIPKVVAAAEQNLRN